MIKLPDISILDLALPIREGDSAAGALPQFVGPGSPRGGWGYKRFWLAEHHNIPGIASAATAVVIGHIAGGTSRIRVGAGGVMLPNHAPLVIAEQFGTLAALYPGRIDLGVGRAPGGDQQTAAALRRNLGSSGDTFPQDLEMNFDQPCVLPPGRTGPGGEGGPRRRGGRADLAAGLERFQRAPGRRTRPPVRLRLPLRAGLFVRRARALP